MSSESQRRQKAAAQFEALRHQRYTEANAGLRKPDPAYSDRYQSAEQEMERQRVNSATRKENESIGRPDPSPNVDVRFGDKS